MRESLHDLRLVVGGNGLGGAVGLDAAIEVELDQTDREELHQLARIVLVRADVACGVGLLIAEHQQVPPIAGWSVTPSINSRKLPNAFCASMS